MLRTSVSRVSASAVALRTGARLGSRGGGGLARQRVLTTSTGPTTPRTITVNQVPQTLNQIPPTVNQVPPTVLVVEGLPPARYAMSMRIMHWTMAGLVIGAVVAVQTAMDQPKTPEGNARRGELMFYHKSCGLTAALLLPIRLVMRFATVIPPTVPAPLPMMWAASLTHYGLYLGMIWMAGTGVLMGYYGARGFPFWVTTLNIGTLDKKTATDNYNWHKQVGFWWKFLIPLHVAGAFSHWALGQRVFVRMNPLW